jgi:hypothetical protein
VGDIFRGVSQYLQKKMLGLRHSHLLANPFKVIIHRAFYHLSLYSLTADRVGKLATRN